LIATAAVALLLTPGVAFANFAIHGGYTQDTDACAGCHRAHTSVSSVTWQDTYNNDHSALLVSNATQIFEFCYACHDNGAQGANTNVEGGVYLERATGVLPGNAPNERLNGGFFGDPAGNSMFGTVRTSKHAITGSWGAFGGAYVDGGSITETRGIDPTLGTGTGAGNQIEMTCASCHDPHGSSNYRLLKDVVNGLSVGGYGADGETPSPFVVSNEPGYPNGTDGTQLGWLKHDMGNVQMQGYQPDYTTPMYAKAPGGDPAKGMSGWCAGCHNAYLQTGTPHGTDSQYDAADGWGVASRHRHPINIALDGDGVAGAPSGYGANKSLTVTLTAAADIPLPLARPIGHGAAATTNTANSWLECLTCHVAHGTDSTMQGFANVASAQLIEPNTGSGGVSPADTSALLRLDNRGVCEVCHNK
jgi:predicted CXXCH cytochrome family protein